METIKVGINGLGRIGRTILREFYKKKKNGELKNIEIVAVNNPGDPTSFIHLLKYDSLHGRFSSNVEFQNNIIFFGDMKIKLFASFDPAEIPWEEEKVDIVLDATGRFKDKESLGKHMRGSVKKVIMCAPGKDLDATFVVGINHDTYDSNKHNIISNASCTTNCLAPIAKVLNDSFGIINGFMTTVHSYTSDQNILDGTHSDLRRARAAAVSMIPTSTGAAKAVGLVLPELKGKLDGYAVRVPTPDVSLVDLTVTLQKSVTVEEINKAMQNASEKDLKNILAYITEPLVSVDFMGRSESSLFDSLLTKVFDKTVKVVSWYDNEVGFSNRVIDLMNLVSSKL